LLIVATAVADEFQDADEVRSCVELSEYVPMTVNWSVIPKERTRFAGEMEIEFSDNVFTVRVVASELSPDRAVMVVEPVSTEVARPAESIVATAELEEVQITELVRSCVLPSE
jgi:hypothetical protein